jgi:hypothetical protein
VGEAPAGSTHPTHETADTRQVISANGLYIYSNIHGPGQESSMYLRAHRSPLGPPWCTGASLIRTETHHTVVSKHLPQSLWPCDGMSVAAHGRTPTMGLRGRGALDTIDVRRLTGHQHTPCAKRVVFVPAHAPCCRMQEPSQAISHAPHDTRPAAAR